MKFRQVASYLEVGEGFTYGSTVRGSSGVGKHVNSAQYADDMSV